MNAIKGRISEILNAVYQEKRLWSFNVLIKIGHERHQGYGNEVCWFAKRTPSRLWEWSVLVCQTNAIKVMGMKCVGLPNERYQGYGNEVCWFAKRTLSRLWEWSLLVCQTTFLLTDVGKSRKSKAVSFRLLPDEKTFRLQHVEDERSCTRWRFSELTE